MLGYSSYNLIRRAFRSLAVVRRSSVLVPERGVRLLGEMEALGGAALGALVAINLIWVRLQCDRTESSLDL